jgi:3-hydroxybutyryl-CoA dehydrogenase
MKIEEVRHIVSLRAGTMGQQIALQCAMHGYDVTVYDHCADVLRDATLR